ncbi:GIY-YIG nuclease family protein [Deinococcus navajonensis]|uniref:GIY-YIG nuclease family protein n=1 Tax=Deinococcus navajonensis TaxID=309884 RepID=A0ABV8XQU4_9DEIO
MTPSNSSIFADRPDLTAALRHMAWAYSLEQREFTWQEIVQQINRARIEMGLTPLLQGAPITLLQKRTIGSPQRDPGLPAHYAKHTRGRYVPVVERLDWRFSAGHSHGEIRRTAQNAVRLLPQPGEDARFVAQGAHLPDTRFVPLTAEENDLKRLDGKRGLYVVRYPHHSYVGQTDEIQVRWRQHRKGGASGGVFVYTEANDLSLEALNTAESLAIAAFKELLRMKNGTVGRDRRPLPGEMQRGSALALMFQAAVVRLAAEGELDDVLVWRAERDVPGLRAAYLALDVGQGEPPTSAVLADLAEHHPDVASPEPVVIAKFGAEGGSIVLGGVQGPQGWTFTVGTDESTLKDLLSEQDLEGVSLTSTLDAGQRWDEALTALDRYPWHQLIILGVHPAFETRLYTAALERGGREDRWIQWRKQQA